MKKSCLILLLLLAGCGPRDYFRTQVELTPCARSANHDCREASLLVDEDRGYALGFVEFDDEGCFYDARQAESVLHWLQNSSEPQYVVVYTHGWHHNASDTDFNVRRFKDSLQSIKQRHPGYRVVGLYLGWRGEILDTPYLRMLTFWNRRAVSERLGRGPFKDFLLQVERTVKAHSENRLLTIGHSLGALAIYNALQSEWLERLRRQGSGFDDLLLLVNPAIEARRFIELRHALPDSEPVSGEPAYPSLMVIGSEADNMTRSAFTWTRAVPALFEPGPDPGLALELPEASPWELSTTAIGHYQPFLTHRLESAPGLSDDAACPAVADGSAGLAGNPQLLAAAGDELPQLNQPSLRLQRLPARSQAAPLWFVQTDKNVLPNHGFLNQKPFWCFAEHSLEQTAGWIRAGQDRSVE
ncbi:hypothetical protein [Methylomonas koyamae]|uniref:hypothetical protein n=1 Tax=Methylomonas koyamae TaxID=702114 RepID=UPI001C329B66|nr:hypothetical protein [Methylomonas koyamae]BBL59222.1 hypothetical protein MKFW12EY_28350 [Methylomonas koyamae]